MWKFVIALVLLGSLSLPVFAENEVREQSDRPDAVKSVPVLDQALNVFRGSGAYQQQLQQEREQARAEQQRYQQEVREEVRQKRAELQNQAGRLSEEMRQENQQTRENVQSRIQDMLQNATGTQLGGQVREQIRELRGKAAAEVIRNRREFELEIQRRRAEFQKELEAKRAEAEQIREEQRTRFMSEVAKLRDARKQEVLTRINGEVNRLNERVTDAFSKMIDQLESVLANIAGRADKAEAGGEDVTAVRTAIAAAKAAIGSARAAVAAQAGKTYPITIESETTVKSDVGRIRDVLHADLSAVREAVQAARGAVQNAAVALAGIPGVDSFRLTTSTAPQEESTSTQ